MRSKLARWFVTAAALAPLACAAACSADPVAAAPDAAAPPTCLATLQLANGAACTGAVVCDYPVECTNGFFEQARCACNGQAFACAFQGAALPKGTAPACQNTTEPPPGACPGSLAATEGKPCTSTGRLCYFAGPKCVDGAQTTDTCECVGGAEVDKLIYKCQRKTCPTSSDDAAAPLEASPDASSDATSDGGRDAPSEGG